MRRLIVFAAITMLCLWAGFTAAQWPSITVDQIGRIWFGVVDADGQASNVEFECFAELWAQDNLIATVPLQAPLQTIPAQHKSNLWAFCQWLRSEANTTYGVE